MEHKELYTSLIPPECKQQQRFTKTGDVYFFGWVLVELSIGRKPEEEYDIHQIREPLNISLSELTKEGFKMMILSCLERV